MKKWLFVVPVVLIASVVAWQLAEGAAPDCKGSAKCFLGTLDKIVDGDTVEVDGQTVRLSLVNTPEKGSPGYDDAISFLERICPLRSNVLVDEDDMQISRSHRRVIAEVHCEGVNLNEALLDSGNAWILEDFCERSEFSSENWARYHGC